MCVQRMHFRIIILLSNKAGGLILERLFYIIRGLDDSVDFRGCSLFTGLDYL